MNWFKNNLANFFTLGNLACGFLGINAIFNNQGYAAFYLILAALILDFLDGFVARLTKTTSKIGADLDSLADMVTFGVLPGFMFLNAVPTPWKLLGLIIPILSAWRLAKFNNDTRPTQYFYGLPTPANAMLIAGAFMPYGQTYCFCESFGKIGMIFIPIALISSILMITNIKLLSNKIKPFNLANAKWHIAVLVSAIVLISMYGYLGVSFAIISYVLISIIATFVSPKIAE